MTRRMSLIRTLWASGTFLLMAARVNGFVVPIDGSNKALQLGATSASFSPLKKLLARPSPKTTTTRITTTTLHMSDIPEEPPVDPEDDHGFQQQLLGFYKKVQLPPAPQDWLVLGGDLMGLTVYGITDHLICADLAQMALSELDSLPKLQAAAGSFYVGAPVWLGGDASTTSLTSVLQVTLHDKLVTSYSPVWQETGAAVVILSAAWLLSGWLWQAFALRHTLQCRTDTALLKTLQTWMTTMILLTAFLWSSHHIFVSYIMVAAQTLQDGDPVLAAATALQEQHAAWITKGDVDYMVGSLTVLAFWRFLVSSMLGTGRDD